MKLSAQRAERGDLSSLKLILRCLLGLQDRLHLLTRRGTARMKPANSSVYLRVVIIDMKCVEGDVVSITYKHTRQKEHCQCYVNCLFCARSVPLFDDVTLTSLWEKSD